MGDRLKQLMAEYGQIALVIYLVLFALTLGGFWVAINAGVEVESAAGTGGTMLAAWAGTKLTQPIRIGAVLVLTPVTAKVLGIKVEDPSSETSELDAGASLAADADTSADAAEQA